MFKKFISILLVVLTVMSTFATVAVSAAENTSANIKNDNVSVSGENSFGNMLATELQTALSQETTSAEFSITGLSIEEKTAMVEYTSAIDCTILVALYDELTGQMLASGKTTANSDNDVVAVAIECEAMPAYFVATAYMLDSNNAPLTDEFTTELYTEDIQKVKAMKATDFDEDRVLKLEDTDETNFAVYSEDTTVLEYKENCNIPQTIDDENGVYVFTNAGDELKNLVSGDLFVYEYSDDCIIIFQVDTIEIDGDTVTITEGEAKLEDVFDYVKIEATQDTSDCEVNMDGIDEDVQLVTESETYSKKDVSPVGVSGDVTFSPEDIKLQLLGDSDGKNISITGDIGFGAEATLEFIISLKKRYFDFSIEYGFDYTIALNVKTKDTIEKAIVNIHIIPVTGVVISFTPSIVFEAEASISFSMSVGGKIGYQLNGSKGKNTSKAPETTSEIEAEGEMFIGLKIEPSLAIVSKKIFKLGLPVTGGVRISAATRDPEEHEDEKNKVNHLCKTCFEGDVSAEISVKADVKVFNKKVGSISATLTKELFTFYFSVDYMDVGKGDCPHSESENFIIDIYVTKGGQPYASAEVWLYSGTYAEMAGCTDANGKLTVYLPYGLYSADVDGELVSFPAYDGTKKVEIAVPGTIEPTENTTPTDSEDVTNPDSPDNPDETEAEETAPYIIESGSCGDNASWEFWDTGELRITGSGDMYDYTEGTTPWYDYTSFITEVYIDYGITGIGNYAFYCMNTNEIAIPVTVKSIGERAFASCKTFESLTIPKNVETIGNDAFADCQALTTVYYNPIECTLLCDEFDSIFDNCASLKTVVFDDTVEVIPDYLFYNCASLNKVDMSDNLIVIGDYSFYGCTGLTTIDIPKNVESVSYSFDGCTNIETVNYYTRNYLGFLKELKTLKTVNFYNEVPDNILSYCDNITKVTFSDGIKHIGSNALYNCDGITEIQLPDSVETIGFCAFHFTRWHRQHPSGPIYLGNILYDCTTDVTEVEIKQGIKRIEMWAFHSCSNLVSVKIPDSVTSIGKKAFQSTSLTSIELPKNLKSIEFESFYDCTDLISVYIPDSVQSIGEGAFYNCSSLTEINLPDSITRLENEVFSGCSSLSELFLPSNLTYIGDNSLSGTALTKINLNDNLEIEYIGEGAFSGSCLSEVILPDNLTRLERNIFRGCYYLNTISLPATLTEIGNGAFCESDLLSIELPENLKIIENEVFRGTRIKSIEIPDSVTTLGFDTVTSIFQSDGVFSDCDSLVDVYFGDNITYIAPYAFYGCSALKTFEIPNSIKTIGDYAFKYCDGLETIDIPESVEFIGYDAFYHCDNLKYAYIYGTPTLDYEVFESNTRIYYLNNGDPKPTEDWSEYNTEPSTAYSTECSSQPCTEYCTESDTDYYAIEPAEETHEVAGVSYSPVSQLGALTTCTAEFDGLIAGRDYIVAVVKASDADDLLCADNLLYICQVSADENGCVSVSYLPKEDAESQTELIFGAEKTSISGAQITAIKHTGSQAVEYTVTLNGVVLTENSDYELTANGDSVTITGINEYTDSLTATVVALLLGDVDGDGQINIIDVTLIQQHIAKLLTISDDRLCCANTDDDGTITIMDATKIQTFIAQLIDEL